MEEYKTVGQFLRDKRLEKNWTINDAEMATRIKKRYIISLEEDDYADMPGDFYTRAYIKQYAERLGADDQLLIDAYENGNKIKVDLQGGYEQVDSSDKEPEEKAVDLPEVSPKLPLILLSATAIIILLGVFAIAIFNKSDNPLSGYVMTETSSDIGSSSDESSIENQKSESQTSESQTSQASSESKEGLKVSGGGASLDVAVADSDNPLKLDISVGDGVESWVSVSNSELASGVTLNASKQSVSTTLANDATSAVISLGVSPGVSISINGQKLDMSALTSETSGTINLNISYKN